MLPVRCPVGSSRGERSLLPQMCVLLLVQENRRLERAGRPPVQLKKPSAYFYIEGVCSESGCIERRRVLGEV